MSFFMPCIWLCLSVIFPQSLPPCLALSLPPSLSELCPQMAFGLLSAAESSSVCEPNLSVDLQAERARDGGIERARDSKWGEKNYVKWDRDSALCCRYTLSACTSLFQQSGLTFFFFYWFDHADSFLYRYRMLQ